MQYSIIALDYTDPDAINRRMANREAHLAGLEKMYQQGIFKSGGSILDEGGTMIGSSVHMEFDSRDALDAWVANDPYTTGKVWEKCEIREIKMFQPAE